MATNLEVIQDALRDINVIAESETASPEQGAAGLRALNDMLEMWTEDSIELGYFKQTSTGATCPIPDWALMGVKAMLAIAIAPKYGASISVELAAKADVAYGTILRKSIVDALKPANMDHMPRGSAGGGRWNILTDSN